MFIYLTISLVIWFGLTICPPAEPRSFTQSLQSLESLAKIELRLYQGLKSLQLNFSKIGYIQQKMGSTITLENSFPPQLMQFIGEYQDEVSTRWRVPIMVENPLAVFKLLHRIVNVTPHVQKLKKYGFALSIERLKKPLENKWPDENDVQDAAEAILRLHHAYNLNITELSDGIIFGMRTEVELAVLHCYQIGMHAKNMGYFTLAMQWLQLSLKKLSNVLDDRVEESNVLEGLEKTVAEHDAAFDDAGWSSPYFYSTKLQSFENSRYTKPAKWEDRQRINFKGRREYSYKDYNTPALCYGETFQTAKEASELFCWKETEIHLIYTIKPLKVELLAKDPVLIQIHDMFGEHEVAKYLRLDNGNPTPKSNRRYISPHLEKEEREYAVKKIFFTPKLATVVGIDEVSGWNEVTSHPTSSPFELRQESGYALSSMSRPFILIFLSNVEAGGFLAFPALGIYVKPSLGSVVLLYNNCQNKQTVSMLKPEFCPVILGRRIVAHSRFQPTMQQSTGTDVELRPGFKRLEENLKKTVGAQERKVCSGMSLKPLNYGSTEGLKAVVAEERSIYHFAKTVYSQSGNITGEIPSDDFCIQRYLKDYEESSGNISLATSASMSFPDLLSQNLLAAYRMTWRFKTFLKRLLWTHHSDKGLQLDAIFKFLQRSYGITQWPDKTYEEDSITAILNTQHILDLKAKEIANGTVQGVNNGVKLNARQCYEIGKFAISRRYHSLAIEWMELASDKIKVNDASIDSETVLSELANSLFMHNEAFARSPGWEPFVFTTYAFLTPRTGRIRRKAALYDKFKMDEDPNSSEINYWGICSGKWHQKEDLRNLKCWYEALLHPFWQINPLKVELLSSVKLKLFQFHDVLSNAVVERLQSEASPALKKSAIKSFFDGEPVINPKWRLSVHATLSREDSKVSKHVSRLVEIITGLKDFSHPEDLEVASYIPGSHYNVHVDSVGHGEGVTPARIASVLFFLSDPSVGGEVAFIQPGVLVKPSKGSMLYWHNLHSSGELNEKSWHGICPVIQGTSWIASKWIHYDKQPRHTCALKPGFQEERMGLGRGSKEMIP